MSNINFKNTYIDWLTENIDQHRINNNIYRLTLPFLDRHNDYIEIYITQDKNDFIISDDSYTMSDLALSGLNLFASKRREQIFTQIIKSHGITLDDNNALTVRAKPSELPLKKHLLIQCMQKISDLFYLSQPNVKSLFLEDVQTFLDKNDIRYIPEASFIGKSKLPTNYDFAIPKSKDAPLRIIKVVNNLTVEYAKSIIFTWNDISDNRTDESQLYTFVQDTDKKASSDALTALEEYDINPVLWSTRSNYAGILAA